MPRDSLAVLNDTMAAMTLGGLEGDPNQLGLIAGIATNAPLARDTDARRQILYDAGGDVNVMEHDELLNIWGGNSPFDSQRGPVRQRLRVDASAQPRQPSDGRDRNGYPRPL